MTARPYHKPDMPSRSYHKLCHTLQAIPHTMPCPPYHNIYHAVPARTYLAMPHQAITYTMPCPPGHTIYLIMHARSYHIPCHATVNDYFGKSCHLSKGANSLITRCTIACKIVQCDDFGSLFAFAGQLISCEN